jgi:hypothetical protein
VLLCHTASNMVKAAPILVNVVECWPGSSVAKIAGGQQLPTPAMEVAVASV